MSFLLSPARRSATTLPSTIARTFTTTSPNRLARMTIVGRIGADPEVSETSSGQKLIRYVVGSSSGPRDNQTTSWFRVASFVAQDSKREEYFMGIGKGTLVYLEGDATMRTYEDAEGKKQTSLGLVQTRIEVLKRPTSTQDSESGHSGV